MSNQKPFEVPMHFNLIEKCVPLRRVDHLVGAEKLFEPFMTAAQIKRIVSGEWFVDVICDLTPAMEKEILEKHLYRFNRRPSRCRSKQYCHKMDEKKWGLTAVPIMFDERGNCLDGQRRLGGALLGNHTVTFRCTFNCPAVTMLLIDIPEVRKPLNVAEIMGHGWVGATGMGALAIMAGVRRGRKQWDPRELQDLLGGMQPRCENLITALNSAKSCRNGVLAAVIIRAALAGNSIKKLERLVEILSDRGDPAGVGERAAQALREYFINTSGQERRFDIIYRTFSRVVSAFLAGEDMRMSDVEKMALGKKAVDEREFFELPAPWYDFFPGRPLNTEAVVVESAEKLKMSIVRKREKGVRAVQRAAAAKKK